MFFSTRSHRYLSSVSVLLEQLGQKRCLNAFKLLYVTLFCKNEIQTSVNCDVRLLFYKTTKYYGVNTTDPTAIHKSSMDGGDNEVIVSSDIMNPISLTVDPRNTSTLYWCDDGESAVHMLFILFASSSSRY